MAIYHLSAKSISRAQGRSATGAAAYRAGVTGVAITDERTGLVHDYTRKGGVLHSELILPGGGTADRAKFWNRIEAHHKRGDAVLVREVEISLPTEMTAEQRQALAVGYARELADRYGVAADVALHAPRTVTDRELEKNPDQYHETDPETGRRHNGNWHAHIMLSACHVQPDGTLGRKAVELDPIHCQRAKIENMADRERARWGELANAALERHGHDARIDHRSLAAQGIDRVPTKHQGPSVSAILRRGGQSQVADRQAEQVARHQAQIDAAQAEAEQIAADLAEAIEAEAEASKYLSGLQEGAEIARLLAGGAVGAAALEKIAPSAFAGLSVAELAAEIEQTRRRLQPTDELARRDPDVSRLAQHRHGLAEQHRQALAEAERHRQEAEAFRAAHGVQAWLHGRGWGHSIKLLAMEQAQEAAQAKAAQIAPALGQAEQAHDEAYTAAAWRIRDAQRPDDERLTALNEARDAALRAEGEAERAELARQEQARRQAEADRQAQARPAPSRRPTHRPAAERDDDGPSLGM